MPSLMRNRTRIPIHSHSRLGPARSHLMGPKIHQKMKWTGISRLHLEHLTWLEGCDHLDHPGDVTVGYRTSLQDSVCNCRIWIVTAVGKEGTRLRREVKKLFVTSHQGRQIGHWWGSCRELLPLSTPRQIRLLQEARSVIEEEVQG
jgi:hypothetical protein